MPAELCVSISKSYHFLLAPCYATLRYINIRCTITAMDEQGMEHHNTAPICSSPLPDQTGNDTNTSSVTSPSSPSKLSKKAGLSQSRLCSSGIRKRWPASLFINRTRIQAAPFIHGSDGRTRQSDTILQAPPPEAIIPFDARPPSKLPAPTDLPARYGLLSPPSSPARTKHQRSGAKDAKARERKEEAEWFQNLPIKLPHHKIKI